MKDYLFFYCFVEKPESWDLYLHLASSAYNKSVHSSIKHCLHELVFPRPPNSPSDDEDTSTLAFKLQDRLRYLQDIALENIDETKVTTKGRFDKNTLPVYYKLGDQVLVKNFARPSKLSSHYSSPYLVIRTSSHNADRLVNDTVKRHHLQNVRPSGPEVLLNYSLLGCNCNCVMRVSIFFEPQIYHQSTHYIFKEK